jgi:alpha-pyrone synthase
MPVIKGISTLEGEYFFSHEELAEWMPNRQFAKRYLDLSQEGSIEGKRTFIPDFRQWMQGQIPTSRRMAVFSNISAEVGTKVGENILRNSGFMATDITHLITISCTGMVAPGLECMLIDRLGLSHDIQRFSVNFMGCYAAFHGLRLGHLLVKENPAAKVLMIAVELSGLHFNQDDSADSLLGTYLFNDGAAGCVLCEEADLDRPYLETISFHSALWPEGKEEMGWKVGDYGFELRLSNRVPVFLKKKVREEMVKLNHSFDYYAIHPGGKNILKAFSQAMQLEDEVLEDSYRVLKKFGNMSSATIMFVLKELLNREGLQSGDVFAAAFGPGLTMESGKLYLNC